MCEVFVGKAYSDKALLGGISRMEIFQTYCHDHALASCDWATVANLSPSYYNCVHWVCTNIQQAYNWKVLNIASLP